jgi:hypothetical protein
MNIAKKENQFEMEAKTCNRKKKRNITYSFVDSYHSLCLDKKEIILAQIPACERLIKYVTDENDMSILGKEVAELRLALDLMH